jgi:hypothetical protein
MSRVILPYSLNLKPLKRFLSETPSRRVHDVALGQVLRITRRCRDKEDQQREAPQTPQVLCPRLVRVLNRGTQ